MNKKLNQVLAVVLTIVALIVGQSANAQVSGTGTEGDPWVVTTWGDLKEKMEAGGYIRLDDNVTDPNKTSVSYLKVPSGKTVVLDLHGHTINRALTNSTTNGYVILVGSNTNSTASLTINDSGSGGCITGGKNSGNGGGVYIYTKASLILNGGSITGNTANADSRSGGGVYISHSTSTFTMNGGTISGNTGKTGGGIAMYDGTFTMNGGSITGNTATTESSYGGGGIERYYGTININGGTISGNTATYRGGGILIHKNGGTASNINLSGVSITGNTAGNCGGGIYCVQGMDITVSGSINITGNTKSDGTTADNVCMTTYSYDPTLLVIGEDLDANAAIGVTAYKTPTANNPVLLTSGLNGRSESFLQSDNNNYAIFQNSDGEAVLGLPTSYTVSASACEHGSVVASPTSAIAGQIVNLTLTPESGYAPEHVYYTPEGGTQTEIPNMNNVYRFTMPATNVTVSAVFALANSITYTITYVNAVNGVDNVTNSNPATYNIETETFTLNDPTRTNYVFAGWYDDASFNTPATTTITQGSSGNKTFYAKWTHDYAGLWHADADHDGSEEKPYLITTTLGLDLLAMDVYEGNDQSGKFFKLGEMITYDHTTDWDDATSMENNFMPIGGSGKPFKGTFDGNGLTISGIRIYKGGSGNEDTDLGLFGYINGGTVKNVTLSDTRITGFCSVGGIVGWSCAGSVVDCNVADNVCIHAVASGANSHGGIVGYNYSYNSISSTINRCISSVKLTLADGLTNVGRRGGIAGWNAQGTVLGSSTISNCVSLGVTIMRSGSNNGYIGAITGTNIGEAGGDNDYTGILTNNYYSNCTVGNATTTANTNVGVGSGSGPSDVTDNEGARGIGRITLGTDVSKSGGTTVTIGSTEYYYAGSVISLSHSDAPTGYTFGGYTAKDAANNDITATVISESTFTMPATDVTLNVAWRKLLTNTDIAVTIPAQTYSGSALTPAVTVTDGTTELTKDTHYTVTLPEGRINAGDYTITITGIGDYDGNTTKTFTITPAPLTVATGSASKVYDRTALTKDEAEIIGLVNGETATITATGSQTEVGSSDNTYNITWDGTAVSTNYNITTETLGTLTVFPITIAAREAATNEYWTTYYNRIANLQVDASTTVYKAAVNTATNRVDLTEITDRIIKASQGVVLKSTHQNITATPVDDNSADDYSGNELKGVDEEMAQDANTTYYVLSKPAGKELGFYKLAKQNSNSEPINLGAHKAYLEVASVNNAPAFFGFGGSGENTTAINEHESHVSNDFSGDYYTLDGRKLQGKPTQKGIYVRNGRKIIIK